MTESPPLRYNNGTYYDSSKVMNHAGAGKLPRIGPKKPSRQSTMHSLNSPPTSHAQLQPLEERRRFVNVVRPLSVFPEPALPPNYTPPVFNTANKEQQSSFNNRYHDYSSMVTQHHPVRGRPPSPAPFPRQQQQRSNNQRLTGSNSNFSLSGQGVGNGYGDHHAPGSAALRVNLAGGSGWDLTAIKRGYNTVGNYGGAATKAYNGGYKSL